MLPWRSPALRFAAADGQEGCRVRYAAPLLGAVMAAVTANRSRRE
jgi:hypothetical protein